MRYEKKLIILSGYGKGVVMAERSGLGVKFALRTFGLPRRTDYKAGIVTPTTVAVRDLPSSADPAAVFFLEDMPLDKVHFAVFDDELCLYGATCPKMWESNLMDLLRKDAAPPKPQERVLPELPPIVEPPASLPLPDGTGIPQSRLALYGDEAIANDNFYSTVDLAPAMARLDRFLDEPRILSADIAPEIKPHSDAVAPSDYTLETTATADESATEKNDYGAKGEDMADYETTGDGIIDAADAVVPAPEQAERISDGAIHVEGLTAQTEAESDTGDVDKESEAAAVALRERREMTGRSDRPAPVSESPSELAAKWLRGRSTSAVVSPKEIKVRKVRSAEHVRPLREAAFIERNSDDVDKLFSLAPKDEELTALLPDIEWVKVEFDGQSVSVGRSGNSFLCYAVAGVYEKVAPIDDAQWLPQIKTAPTGKGYWLVFQDLVGGGIIKQSR